MKNTITKKEAESKIQKGTAWITGQTTSGARAGDPEPYWVITSSEMRVYHLEVEESPELDKVKAI